jgi:tetratricopeptide (TPR) repeat protein
MAGVGKTELALQLVHDADAARCFPGGIFWLDAENPDLNAQWGVLIADQYGIAQAPPSERCAGLFRELSRSGDPILIVLDNVAQWSTDRPRPLPVAAKISVLVTSREWRSGGNAFQHHELSVLSPPADRDLLCATASTELDSLEPLLEYLGGHALALELAGTYLGYRDSTPAQYLTLLQRDRDLGSDIPAEPRCPKTVAHVFHACWERLDAEGRAAWQLCSCFAPESATLALSEAVGLSKEALRTLAKMHLVRFHDGRWSMHRLTHAFGERAGTEEERESALEHFVKRCMEHSASMRSPERRDGFIVTGQSRLQRMYASDRSHFDRALECAMQMLGSSHASVRGFQIVLARARHSLGDAVGSQALFERLLKLDLEQLGEAHPRVAKTRTRLAYALANLGELDRARELLEPALEANVRNLGHDHPEVNRAKFILSGLLRTLGEADRALALAEEALSWALKHLGEDHPSIAGCRSILALALQATGELPRARALLEQALAAKLRDFREDDFEIAKTRIELAGVLHALGELSRARTLSEQALEASLGSCGESHLDVLRCRATLASVLFDLGEREAARWQAQEVLRCAQRPEQSRAEEPLVRDMRRLLGAAS